MHFVQRKFLFSVKDFCHTKSLFINSNGAWKVVSVVTVIFHKLQLLQAELEEDEDKGRVRIHLTFCCEKVDKMILYVSHVIHSRILMYM